MALKLKVKKTLLKRKVDGATLSGYGAQEDTRGLMYVGSLLF